MKKLIFLLSALLCISPLYAKKTQLEMNLEEGMVFKTIENMDMVMGVQFMGVDMNITSDVVLSLTTTVKEAGHKGFLLNITYDRMVMNFNMLGMNFSVTSDDDDNNNPTSVYARAIVGKSFDVVIDRRGAIVEYIGMEKMFDDMVEEVRTNLPTEGIEDIRTTLSQYFNKEYLGRNVGLKDMFSYPAEPVKKGYKWSEVSELKDNMIVLEMNTEYEFVGKKSGYWIITAKSWAFNIKGGSLVEMDDDISNMNMDGAMVSEIKIDPATGWIHRSVSKLGLNGVIEIKDGGKLPVSINMTSETKTD